MRSRISSLETTVRTTQSRLDAAVLQAAGDAEVLTLAEQDRLEARREAERQRIRAETAEALLLAVHARTAT
ncbi:hypothetical protein [Streptomyces hydrogenans]|uniref:hypothetical protein n=1 Tax=Streptomyces hydrogenans TaxID=1873719 RepID=UPI003826D946